MEVDEIGMIIDFCSLWQKRGETDGRTELQVIGGMWHQPKSIKYKYIYNIYIYIYMGKNDDYGYVKSLNKLVFYSFLCL